jgi:hypothetical protein
MLLRGCDFLQNVFQIANHLLGMNKAMLLELKGRAHANMSQLPRSCSLLFERQVCRGKYSPVPDDTFERIAISGTGSERKETVPIFDFSNHGK